MPAKIYKARTQYCQYKNIICFNKTIKLVTPKQALNNVL